MSKKTTRGAIAAGHELTAKAGADVLASGGSAIDAAIAAAWMACVAEPVLASPGGGGFAMVRGADGRTRLFDFFVQTPRHKRASGTVYREAHADFGTAKQAFHIGGGASAAPGFVPGMFALHDAGARLSLAELAHPAIRAARDGVEITAFQAFLAQVVSPILLATPESRAVFAPDGQLPNAGARVSNLGLARFISTVTEGNASQWLDGDAGVALVASQCDGHLASDDFRDYTVDVRQPLSSSLSGGSLHLNPPPSAGGMLIEHAFAVLEGAGLADGARALDQTDQAWRAPDSALAARIAAGHRAAYRGTTHISVIDADGNAVAVTLSNGEGNGGIVGDFGFMLNNMLGEEDVNPDGALGWMPSRRLSSMMCPVIAETADGGLIALGSGGSNRIRSAIFHVLRYRLGQGLALDEAVAAPRAHVERGHVDFEPSGEDAALKAQFASYRAWPAGNLFFGGCHGVERLPDGTSTAAGDPRRAGVAIVV